MWLYTELSEVKPNYSERPTPNIGTIRSSDLCKILLRLEHLLVLLSISGWTVCKLKLPFIVCRAGPSWLLIMLVPTPIATNTPPQLKSGNVFSFIVATMWVLPATANTEEKKVSQSVSKISLQSLHPWRTSAQHASCVNGTHKIYRGAGAQYLPVPLCWQRQEF